MERLETAVQSRFRGICREHYEVSNLPFIGSTAAGQQLTLDGNSEGVIVERGDGTGR